jgi:hypothetical protein
MSTLLETQEAITQLKPDEKDALSLWLVSQTEPVITPADEQALLRSLDEAARDLDAGKGRSVEQVRTQLASRITK